MSISSMRLRSMVAAVVTLGFTLAPAVYGQKLDRSVRPVAPPNKTPVFPAANAQQLPNGLRVVIVENHSLPLVAARAVLAFDSTADAAGKEGLYVATLGMLREGTMSRTADQIATSLGSLGADVSPTRFTTVAARADSSLALMADLLMHPAFPEAAVERRKAVQAAALQRQLQATATAPRRILYAEMFGAGSAHLRAIPSSDAGIKSITRDDITKFYSDYFHPENVTLVIVGDVRTADVLARVTQLFGSWPHHGATYVMHAEPAAPPAPTTIYLLDRPKATQVYASVGQLGPSHSAADVAALEALIPVLGTGAQSRLTRNIRERHAYMYSGTLYGVTWLPQPQQSMLYGTGAFAPAKTDSTLIEWISELKAIRNDRPPTEQEVVAVRTVIVNNLSNALETVDRLADRLVFLTRAGTPLDYDNQLVRSVAKLSAADIQAAATAHIDLEHLAIVVAGDRATLEPLLRATKIAPVVLVDENGKRLP